MQQESLEIGVIGLGKFGLQLSRTLVELGHSVVGVDTSDARIRQAQDILAQVYIGDAADIDVLQQLRFQDLDYVVVSVGESMEASLLVTLNLQEIGARKIYVKAVSPEHQKVLARLGVDHVIQPEHDVATHLAHRLANPGMLDLLPLGGSEQILLQELTVQEWAGKTLMDLRLANEHGVIAVAIKPVNFREYRFVPNALEKLQSGDTLVVIGPDSAVMRLEP